MMGDSDEERISYIEPSDGDIVMMVNLERANEMMKKSSLDALVAFSTANVYYLTDYHSGYALVSQIPSSFAVFPKGGEPILVMPIEDEGFVMADELKLKDHHFYGKHYGNMSDWSRDEGDPFKLIAEVLRRAGAGQGRIGYDGELTPTYQFEIERNEIYAERRILSSCSRHK